jgi:hypothetical protein
LGRSELLKDLLLLLLLFLFNMLLVVVWMMDGWRLGRGWSLYERGRGLIEPYPWFSTTIMLWFPFLWFRLLFSLIVQLLVGVDEWLLLQLLLLLFL